MAVSSNRSPSPVSARTNLNSRTPEFNNPVRRSFSGNPFNKPLILSNPRSFNPTTPSNSPSDFGQRNSIDRNGGFLRENEEKENEREQSFKPVKIRSPAVSKHFMSPTISAVSKITASSPRKKVLADRNEPIRTSSVSISDAKPLSRSMILSDNMEDYDSNSEICSNQMKIEPSIVGLEARLIPKAPKIEDAINSKVPSNSNETESSVSTVTSIDPNCANGDLNARFKISPSPSPCSPCPILAPLDADPSVPPPYDPKTNYLSPRPQFLHYRPNPRVGIYLNKESFIFESFSDTETTDETESEDSQKESEDDSPAEKEPDVSELDPISTELPTKTVEARGVSKKLFCSRSKSISLLLILVVACLSISVTDTPVDNGTLVLKDQTFSKFSDPYEFAKFAKTNFEGLARKFRFWSANSFSYLAELIQLPEEVQNLGVLQFYNMTDLQEDHFLDGSLMIYASNEKGEEKYKQNELGSIREVEAEIGSLEEKDHTEIGADEDVSESQNGPEVRETDNEVTGDEISEAEEEMFIRDKGDVSLHSNAELEQQFSEVQPEVPEDKGVGEHDKYLDSCVETESIEAEETPDYSKSIVTNENSQSLGTLDSAINRSSEAKLSSVSEILGISLLSLTLVAASAFVYARQRKSSAIPIQEFPKVDMGSESCPSEMSSFQNYTSYSKRAGRSHEAQMSLEKKMRRSSKRESMATSSDFSMDSPSYGSFTTYEIIPRKHGDEETMTPVRRSSRIKSQVTSP